MTELEQAKQIILSLAAQLHATNGLLHSVDMQRETYRRIYMKAIDSSNLLADSALEWILESNKPRSLDRKS